MSSATGEEKGSCRTDWLRTLGGRMISSFWGMKKYFFFFFITGGGEEGAGMEFMLRTFALPMNERVLAYLFTNSVSKSKFKSTGAYFSASLFKTVIGPKNYVLCDCGLTMV